MFCSSFVSVQCCCRFYDSTCSIDVASPALVASTSMNRWMNETNNKNGNKMQWMSFLCVARCFTKTPSNISKEIKKKVFSYFEILLIGLIYVVSSSSWSINWRFFIYFTVYKHSCFYFQTMVIKNWRSLYTCFQGSHNHF